MAIIGRAIAEVSTLKCCDDALTIANESDDGSRPYFISLAKFSYKLGSSAVHREQLGDPDGQN
jgi:hypothetical protein